MRRTSRVRATWPPPDTQPPWERLFNGEVDAGPAPDHGAWPPEPAIAHLPAAEIAQQLVELIHDEAGALEHDARRQVAQAIQRAVRPWLSA